MTWLPGLSSFSQFIHLSNKWTWVGANSGRWWRTGKPDVLQFVGPRRVGRDSAAERQRHPVNKWWCAHLVSDLVRHWDTVLKRSDLICFHEAYFNLGNAWVYPCPPKNVICHCCCSVTKSGLISFRPHGLQCARLPYPSLVSQSLLRFM